MTSIIIISTAVVSIMLNLQTVRITGWFGLPEEPAYLLEEYIVGVDLYVKPSLWNRFTRLQRVEYTDPRFITVGSWVVTRAGIGSAVPEEVRIDDFNPRAVRGESLVDGDKEVLLHLRRIENFTEVSGDFSREIRVYLSFLWFHFSVIR